jgi:LPS-assembly lipoprotein
MRKAQETTDFTDRTDVPGRGFVRAIRVIRGSILSAAACAALGGCGFAPLYAQDSVVPRLASIDVVAPQGRTGFLIREHLDDAFAKNRDTAPAYRMHLQLAETRYPRGVRVDNVATRYEYVLTAAYQLAALPSGAPVKTGTVHVELTYDSPDQPYASVAAQEDAQDRAAEEAARRIQRELAAWLATGQPAVKRAVVPPAPPVGGPAVTASETAGE